MHSSTVASDVFRIYIKGNRHSKPSVKPNDQALNTLLDLPKKGIIRLKKEIDKTIVMREMRVRELRREERGLLEGIRGLRRRRHRGEGELEEGGAFEDKYQTADGFVMNEELSASPVTTPHHTIQIPLPITASTTNKSLYER